MARCECCVYGAYSSLPCILASIAIVLTWVSAFSCHFFQVTLSNGDTIGVGLWTVEDYYYYSGSACSAWYAQETLEPDVELDGAMKFARAISLMTCILSMAVYLLVMMFACMRFDTRVYIRVVVIAFLTLSGMSLLYLTGLASKVCQDAVSCKIVRAGYMCIAASISWLGSAIATNFLTSKRPKQERGAPTTTQPAQPETIVDAEAHELSPPVALSAVVAEGSGSLSTQKQDLAEQNADVFASQNTTTPDILAH